jgi:hypothetical protein
MQEIQGDKLTYTGAAELVTLRGPSSQILRIPFDATTRIQWAPVDRRVVPLEIRAQVLSWEENVFDGPPLRGLPIVRMRIGYGHAQQTLQEPVIASAQNSGAVTRIPVAGIPIPARGFVARITARELLVDLQFTANNANRPSVTVVVSVQPVESMHMPQMGTDEHQTPPEVAGAVRPASAFPPWAHEWKVFDRTGQPFADGGAKIALFDLQGLQFQVFDGGLGEDVPTTFEASSFAEWTPITLDMFAWKYTTETVNDNVGVYAAYR